VLPRHKLEAALEHGEYKNAWATTASPADFAVSGPFTLEEYTPGQRTTLKRNEHYWKKDTAGNQLPYLDKIVIEAVDNPNTGLLKFQQGDSTFSTTFARLITRRSKTSPARGRA